MHNGLHPRSYVDKLYVPRREGGRGLMSVEDTDNLVTTEDCAKDGGEEYFTEIHCILSNSYRIIKDL